MNITKENVKNHLRKHHVKYIIGGSVAIGAASLIGYYHRLGNNHALINANIAEKLMNIDPSIAPADLRFAHIDKKLYMALVPKELGGQNMTDIIEHVKGPIIFGAATAVTYKDELIAVFPK